MLPTLRKGRWAILLTALFAFSGSTQDRVQLCAACHGADGNSVNPQVPSIAGQPRLFIENQLILFREELRKEMLRETKPAPMGMKALTEIRKVSLRGIDRAGVEATTVLDSLDAGPLASSRALENMCAVIVNLNRRYGGHGGVQIVGL